MAERTPATPRIGPFLSAVSATPTPTPLPPAAVDTHPVEVVGRIRNHPDGIGQPSVLQALPNGRDLRITSKEHQQGYRVFSLDGVSRAEDEDLEAFYLKYAEARVEDVKLGGKCTIMMYGPTGAGKSHTMFGSGTERGVAYHALIQIMGDGLLDESGRGQEVKATVWEIFNEDIYDLLAQTSNPPGSMKGQMNRVKLEVKGKKVRNSTCINDYDPNRLLKEIQKVEKRRVVKSTNCNDRSSRSHCVVTFEVPAVDGRLVLVDMAGSENIEQAGIGSESKMQTGKINQGNGALKRVVEAIANGENHIPYRDSKLTMILQESFEDKNAKVLMILCASPCPKDLYKTLGTFEYGAKAKRIVRLPNSPAREKASEEELQKLAVVNAKDIAKDQCILKLRRDKEKSDREREVQVREVKDLRRKVDELESQLSTRQNESEVQLHEYRRHADLQNEHTKRRLEELELQLQQKEREAEFHRLRADKAEAELNQLKRISFSNLESDPESADWGSIKQHNSSSLAIVKVESPGNRAEKGRGLSPLAVIKSNGFGSSSSPSPKEKKDKKFSSSVLSFFKGSDSSNSSKKSSNNRLESKSKENPHLQLTSPKSEKSEKKRQAGQEAPSPKTAEKKRHTTGQDTALKALIWPPSTLQELLKVNEEQGSREQQHGSQGQESSTKPSLEDGHLSWFTKLQSMNNTNKDIVLPDAPQTITDTEIRSTTTPDETDQQVSMTYVNDYQEELSLQVEKDPLGLGTWSESKLHRRGWLPIIVEEKEEELERLARKSLEEAAQRASMSCPRLSDGSHYSKLGSNNSVHSSSSGTPTEQQNRFFPSNLLRDKFSSPSLEQGAPISSASMLNRSNSVVKMEVEEEAHPTSSVKNAEGSMSSSSLRSASPVDSFLQRLGPSLSEVSDYGDDNNNNPASQISEARDELPPVVEAASARKARIENIFLLCGHRREIAARVGGESPSPSVPASPIVREDRDPAANLRSDSFRENNSLRSDSFRDNLRSDSFRDNLRSDSFRDFSLGEPMSPFHSVPSSPLPSYRESPLPSYRESPLPSYRERDNQSHLSLEVEGYYSPARTPSRTTTTTGGNFQDRMRSPVSPEVMSSPLLPVLPSPQKSDSPSRHRKFRTGNLFQFSNKPNGEQGPILPGTPEGSSTGMSPGGGGGSVSPAYSVRKLSEVVNIYGDENEVRSNNAQDYIPQCDVYVKWESKDTSGKFICVLKLPKGATLADLRREIQPHVPTGREDFTFLMLGDTGGAPVEQELEPDLRVSSLPDCPTNKGSRLASLRPPITHQVYVPPSRPFRPIENTISANSLENNGANGGKLVSSKSLPKLGNSNGKVIQTQSNSSSLVKGLRTLATGVGLRGGQPPTFRAIT
ncbi:unnamed protein product [Calypogeia fissa]